MVFATIVTLTANDISDELENAYKDRIPAQNQRSRQIKVIIIDKGVRSQDLPHKSQKAQSKIFNKLRISSVSYVHYVAKMSFYESIIIVRPLITKCSAWAERIRKGDLAVAFSVRG